MPTFHVTFISGETITAELQEENPIDVVRGASPTVVGAMTRQKNAQVRATPIAINRAAIAYVALG